MYKPQKIKNRQKIKIIWHARVDFNFVILTKLEVTTYIAFDDILIDFDWLFYTEHSNQHHIIYLN